MSNGAEARMRRSREKILNAAERVFLKNGFLGTNMDAVAQKADVSKQTVYAHFGSKRDLFIAVVAEMTGGASRAIREDVADDFGDEPAASFFSRIAEDQLAIVMTPRLMRLRRMVIGEVERFPELGRALFENGPKRSIDRIAKACRHYTDRGELHTPDPQAAATQFNWILMGAPTSAAMFLGDQGIPETAELIAHAREAARIFLSAYGPESR